MSTGVREGSQVSPSLREEGSTVVAESSNSEELECVDAEARR